MIGSKIRAKLRLLTGMAAAVAGLASSGCRPEQKALSAGDVAPAFALTGSDGKVHRLADYRGKLVVLAWFPKAFTGG